MIRRLIKYLFTKKKKSKVYYMGGNRYVQDEHGNIVLDISDKKKSSLK